MDHTPNDFPYPIEVVGDCWEWRGLRTAPNGYGRVIVDGKRLMAHRVVYEACVGAIPDGLVIDHLCRNKPCVNPAHLEPVTQTENVRRALPYYEKRAAKCGHDREGRRNCRECQRLYDAERNRARPTTRAGRVGWSYRSTPRHDH